MRKKKYNRRGKNNRRYFVLLTCLHRFANERIQCAHKKHIQLKVKNIKQEETRTQVQNRCQIY